MKKSETLQQRLSRWGFPTFEEIRGGSPEIQSVGGPTKIERIGLAIIGVGTFANTVACIFAGGNWWLGEVFSVGVLGGISLCIALLEWALD